MASKFEGGDSPGAYASGFPPGRPPDYSADMEMLIARVTRLEEDVREIKDALNQLVPKINEMHGFLAATLPTLATKAELAAKPSKGYMWGIIGVLTAAIFAAVALGAMLASSGTLAPPA